VPKMTIKANIRITGVEIEVDTDEDLNTEDAAQAFVDSRGLGSTDFNLDIGSEEIEVYDVFPSEGK